MLLQSAIILGFMSLAALIGFLVAWIWWTDKAQESDTLIYALQRELESVIKAKTELTEELNNAQGEDDKQQEALVEAKARIKALQAQLDSAQVKYWEQFQHSVVAQEAEIAELRGKFNEQNQAIKRLQAENNQMREELGKPLGEQVNTIELPSRAAAAPIDMPAPAGAAAAAAAAAAPSLADAFTSDFNQDSAAQDDATDATPEPSLEPELPDDADDDDGLRAAFETEFGLNDEALPSSSPSNPAEEELLANFDNEESALPAPDDLESAFFNDFSLDDM